MTISPTTRTIFIVAGDVSGDRSAGQLALAISRLRPDVQLRGVGGAAMRRAGVDVLVETTELSAIGPVDAARLLRPLFQACRTAQRALLDSRPDLVLLVDSELVNLPTAWWLRRRGIAASFYFPPQVWLWGRWRLPLMTKLVRRVLSAFRPEAEMFASAGVDTTWVGHPLSDMTVDEDPQQALAAIGIDARRPIVALMPGSRQREVRTLGPVMLAAAKQLRQRDPTLQFVLPIATESLRRELEEQVDRSGLADVKLYEPRSYAVLSRARVVIQCSGTATLEVAMLGIPAVIAYRVHPIEYAIGRSLLINTRFIGMPNILLDEMVQPEFFNRNLDAEHLAEQAWSLLTDEERRHDVITKLARVRDMLGAPGALARTAEAVVQLLDECTVEVAAPAPALNPHRPAPSPELGPASPS
jgi:lipid-A-disaccharide synthase